MTHEVELNDIPKNNQDCYVVHIVCSDCGEILNSSHVMTGEDIHKNWTTMCLTSGFASKSCPKGCRSTFSDLNINTKFKIVRTNQ